MPHFAFQLLIAIWLVVGVLVLPLTLYITAPFGRHASNRFGPSISNRMGWLIMESPAIWCFGWVFLATVSANHIAAWILAAMWMFHYVYRGVVFPFRIRTTGKKIPLLIITCAFSFQCINGYINGAALGTFGSCYTAAWFASPNFWIGGILFTGGWIVHFTSDATLLALRSRHDVGYHIPYGKLYRWVSCPNFLGEIIQWCGWAVMCWNLAALSFAVWTIANLVPRALAHHRWYQEHFLEYPTDRKAVFPGLL